MANEDISCEQKWHFQTVTTTFQIVGYNTDGPSYGFQEEEDSCIRRSQPVA